MRLLSFTRNKKAVAGAALNNGRFVIDLERASRSLGSGGVPGSVREILEGGEPMIARTRRVVRRAEAKLKRVLDKKERRPVWMQPVEDVELGPPIPNPEKIICIGQNYIDHCREQGVQPPESPIIFAKFPSSLTGPASPVELPATSLSEAIDFEVELAVVIGREARGIKKRAALDHVAGYMVMNDITARDIQRSDGQWVRAKAMDSFGPCGPWIVTPDELGEVDDLRIWLELNGELMQDSSTKNLIFNVPALIEFVSRGITLKPGDVIATGTPPGVGAFRKPPVFLQPGDVLHCGITGIGSIQNRCRRRR